MSIRPPQPNPITAQGQAWATDKARADTLQRQLQEALDQIKELRESQQQARTKAERWRDRWLEDAPFLRTEARNLEVGRKLYPLPWECGG